MLHFPLSAPLFFAIVKVNELLRYFNITGTVSGIAPTESIHLELHRMYEDFNLSIHPILMSDRDANDLFENLQRKKDCGEPLTKEDLVPLTLSLLMGGAMPMEDRVTQTFRYLQEEPLEKEDQQNLEALTYALATKFLDQSAMKKLEGMIKMTELGQMLYNDGLADGIAQSILSIARNLLGSVSDEFIIEKTGITPEQLQELKEEKASADKVP